MKKLKIKKEILSSAIIFMIIFLVFLINFPKPTFAERKYLFKWDEGENVNMPGWTYTDDVAYGHPGWTLNADGPFGGGKDYMWGYGPRSFEKGSYGDDSLAIIDQSSRCPATSTGGSFKVYDSGLSDTHQATWWLWYDGEPLSQKGITDANTNRWSFYIKLDGISEFPKTGGSENVMGAGFHVGTYVCDYTGNPAYGTGDGCPYEGPGNQHYYHYLHFEPGAWIHVLLDQHPQHRRDSFVAGDNPTMITNGFNYMEHLNQWYMEIRDAQEQPTAYWLDEMYFYSTGDGEESAEPNQNDISITSVWVGYWPNEDKWQIFWEDESYENSDGENTNDDTNSTFQIRWSTEPITNDNWNEASPINAEFYAGEEYTGLTDRSFVRRPNAWSVRAWTQFELPDEIEQNNNHVYFAIKDVSIEGGHVGTQWPWNKIDGHDAVSPYIHTIDYYLRPDGDNIIRADVDNNSTINTTDAMLTLRNSLGLSMSGTNWFSSTTTGDVNCDGNSNSTDAMLILRHSLGLDMTGTGWCE